MRDATLISIDGFIPRPLCDGSGTPKVPISRIELAERRPEQGWADCVCFEFSDSENGKPYDRFGLKVLVVVIIDIGRISIHQVRSMLVILGACCRWSLPPLKARRNTTSFLTSSLPSSSLIRNKKVQHLSNMLNKDYELLSLLLGDILVAF